LKLGVKVGFRPKSETTLIRLFKGDKSLIMNDNSHSRLTQHSRLTKLD